MEDFGVEVGGRVKSAFGNHYPGFHPGVLESNVQICDNISVFVP